ncbi:TonB-dependent receptor [Mucilaginibacter koreensis]
MQSAWAQNKTITGKVTDAKDGSTLPGVTVSVKGTTIGTQTTANGTYRLSVPASATTLVFSYVGYDRMEVSVAGKTVVDAALAANSTTLNEVQVVSVGYGTARKKDVTGAVSNLSSQNFNKGAITNPIDQISGKVAGLQITQPGGDPNQNATIRLRGQTSLNSGLTPLFVVDGVILDDPNQFQNIPPNDIESYDVLKDVSATAIYGSRGANGVIIVNTKRGRAGKTTVDYNGYVSVGKQAKYYDLLTADQLRAQPNLPPSLNLPNNTDWQKAITRTAFTQSHNVALSGGAESFNYRASVNYQKENGIVLNSGKEQLGFRFNAQQKAFNDKLDIQVGIQNVSTTRRLTDYSNFIYVFNAPPTFPVYNADGSFNDFTGFAQANPVERLTQTTNLRYEYLTLLNASANYTLAPGLKAGVFGSIYRNNIQYRYFQPTFPNTGNLSNGSQNVDNRNSYKGDVHLNYDKTFGKHTVSATGVYEYNDYIFSSFGASGQDFLDQNLGENALNSGNPAKRQTPSSKDEFLLISFLARVNYNYDSRYYLTASIRRDGSSKFGTNYTWGTFPSISASYRIKRDFFQDVNWLSDLKIRAGYGKVGNSDNIYSLSTLGLIGANRNYSTGDVSYPYAASARPTQNPNNDLRWEERVGRNIGIDFDLFNGRLSGDINYFNDKTNNLIYTYTVPTPPFLFNNILANVGNLSNKGIEFAINAQPVKGDKFNWSTNITFTKVRTRVNSLSGQLETGGQTIPLSAPSIQVGYPAGQGLSNLALTYLTPGYTPFVFYLAHYTGLDAAGNQLFDGKTRDQWGGIQNAPKYYIDPSPKFNYGFANTFSYGNWSLNFLLRGVYGQKIYNNTQLNLQAIGRIPNLNVSQARLTDGTTDSPEAISDRWLENASFLRLDNATISYTFKSVPYFQSLRAYVATNNLFVITKYKGLDPEIKTENGNGSNNQAYIDVSYGDRGYYPRTRSFTLGISASFK